MLEALTFGKEYGNLLFHTEVKLQLNHLNT